MCWGEGCRTVISGAGGYSDGMGKNWGSRGGVIRDLQVRMKKVLRCWILGDCAIMGIWLCEGLQGAVSGIAPRNCDTRGCSPLFIFGKRFFMG